MKELSFEQMESLNGGSDLAQCIGGVAGFAFLIGCAIFAPAVTYAVMITGEGAMLSAGILEQSYVAVTQGCN